MNYTGHKISLSKAHVAVTVKKVAALEDERDGLKDFDIAFYNYLAGLNFAKKPTLPLMPDACFKFVAAACKLHS